MWHWDQGRLEYFQFDNLRKIARFLVRHNFKNSSRELLLENTGLPFSAPQTHSPWRNYSRILKLMLLIREEHNLAIPTPVAELLASTGVITCDEYIHFIATTFTEPSPALQEWRPDLPVRYPLLFALKYLLAKVAIHADPVVTFDEIIGAYAASNFRGDENAEQYSTLLISQVDHFHDIGLRSNLALRRQARESILFLAQISYLHRERDSLVVSINSADAIEIFEDIVPPVYIPAQTRDGEIFRLACLFREGSSLNDFDYTNTMISNITECGFTEGGRIKKTHIAIERNSALRRDYFLTCPTSTCDLCGIDTSRSYPWAEKIIDLHHLLPLASGTRVELRGTTFSDLVPICPTCHRATHRFYDNWLSLNGQKDFSDSAEAKNVYTVMKANFEGLIYAFTD